MLKNCQVRATWPFPAVVAGQTPSHFAETRFFSGGEESDTDPNGKDTGCPKDKDEAANTGGSSRDKTIAEAFDDLDAEEKETVNRLLDRMTGRKQ